MRKLLEVLGFTPKENTSNLWTKRYENNYTIIVDFDNKQINY
jgi:hypothetical protein